MNVARFLAAHATVHDVLNGPANAAAAVVWMQFERFVCSRLLAFPLVVWLRAILRIQHGDCRCKWSTRNGFERILWGCRGRYPSLRFDGPLACVGRHAAGCIIGGVDHCRTNSRNTNSETPMKAARRCHLSCKHAVQSGHINAGSAEEPLAAGRAAELSRQHTSAATCCRLRRGGRP